jgi:hypothetical protein
MRALSISVAVAAGLLASAAFGQTPGSVTGHSDQPYATTSPDAVGPGAPPPGQAPEVGGPLLPATDTGLDKVASDGISTRTVRAAPCSAAAKESDGTTTCVGIRGPVRTRVAPAGTTTGLAR